RSSLDAVCDRITGSGGRASSIVVDITRSREVADAFDGVVARTGRLDILVNSAGGQLRQPALDITEEGWDRLMAVNLKAVFFSCQKAARHMRDAGRGRIISVSSLTGEIGLPNLAAYGA